jgi:thiol-disulfide isomerase/thioredoxin
MLPAKVGTGIRVAVLLLVATDPPWMMSAARHAEAGVRSPSLLAATVDPASRPGADTRAGTNDPDPGSELVGRMAPAWSFERWVRGPETRLADLRGKVVLVRWWTEGCHFCSQTLPVLEKLRQERRDLVVIGVFHPKPPREVSDRHILQVARRLGFNGPVAFDRDWTALGRYWLDGHPDRSWTSVSFLIDREGRIRWVHGGGEYHPSSDPRHARCDLEYRKLESVLTAVLGEAKEGHR